MCDSLAVRGYRARQVLAAGRVQPRSNQLSAEVGPLLCAVRKTPWLIKCGESDGMEVSTKEDVKMSGKS